MNVLISNLTIKIIRFLGTFDIIAECKQIRTSEGNWKADGFILKMYNLIRDCSLVENDIQEGEREVH